MQEYKIILTWEAIYDVTDIADYIEEEESKPIFWEKDIEEEQATVFCSNQMCNNVF